MDKKILLKDYIKNKNLVNSQIESFNNFCDIVLPQILEENEEIRPAIVLPTVDDVKIVLRKIWVEKPEIHDVFNGSNKPFYPFEARMRKLTYAGSVKAEAVFYLDQAIKEIATVEIAKLPIMVKSKYCNLTDKDKEELIELGEDIMDTGGYFIINGNERIIAMKEDLAENRLFIVEKDGVYKGAYLAGKGVFRNPVTIEIKKDGSIVISSGVLKNIPFPLILKALGMENDQEIFNTIGLNDELIILNLYEWAHITNPTDAKLEISKISGQMQSTKEMRLKRINDILKNYFMSDIKNNYEKALNIAKLIKRLVMYKNNEYEPEDRDHYANKRVKLAGDLLEEIFKAGFRLLIRDTIYNIQKYFRRGRLPSLNILIREKVINQRLEQVFNTGQWMNTTGVSQSLQKTNSLDIFSHLTRVSSTLEASLKHIRARRLHGTHWGRFDLIETPEGKTIGLRKQLTLFAKISQEIKNKNKVIEDLKKLGIKRPEIKEEVEIDE